MFQQLLARQADRKAWEAANAAPVCACHGLSLTEAWNAALLEDHQQTLRAEMEAARARAELGAPEMLRRVGVPEEAIRALTALQKTDAVEAALKFLEAPREGRRFLVLAGAKGTGKTVAAAVVARGALVRHRAMPRASGGEAREAPVAAFVRATTFARLSLYDAGDKAAFEELCRARVLVLDDLASELLSPVTAALLMELVDRRYGGLLKTVITTNLDFGAFYLRVGERCADRIQSTASEVTVRGQSRRVRKDFKKAAAP